MSAPMQCPGTLLWFDVPADDRFAASAICMCTDCGALFISGGLLDDRHVDPPVVRA